MLSTLLFVSALLPTATPCGGVPGSPVVKYSTKCNITVDNGWNAEDKAEGAANDSGSDCTDCGTATNWNHTLICTSFAACDPANNDVITGVSAAVRVKGGSTGMQLKVGAKTKNFTPSSSWAWVEMDVTSLSGAWTWDQVNGLDVQTKWVSGSKTQTVYVDAVRVTVTFTACTPNASKFCSGLNAVWRDSCGFDGAVAQSCDDGNGCTVDACVGAGQCSNSPTPNTSTTCSGNRVYYVDSCGNLGAEIANCDDGKPCTDDACANSQCSHTPKPNVGIVCSNGNRMYVDSCGAVGGLAENCNDGVACTVDSCSPTACGHSPTPNTQKVCYDNDVYAANSCGQVGGKTEECSDNDACTIDACDPTTLTCTHTLDEVACPKCTGSTPKCFDNSRIFVDSCNNVVSTESCDDGDKCTIDGCDPTSFECTHAPVTSGPCVCDDGEKLACQSNALVRTDLCDSVLEVLEDCDDSDACTIDACDASGSGQCVHTPKDDPVCKGCVPAGVSCLGNQLFAIDSCGNTGAVADTCADDDPCTTDGCDVATATCKHTPSTLPGCPGACEPKTTSCEGNSVVQVDACGNKLSLVEACDDKDECTLDTC